MDELTSLVALVDADRWIERVRGQKSQLPELVALHELEIEMKSLASVLTELTATLAPLKTELSQSSTAVSTLAQRKVELERRSAAPAATPKELVAVQSELEHVLVQLGEAQNREVELFLRCEPLELELANSSEGAKAMVARRTELRKSLDELTASLDEEIASLIASRTLLVEAVPERLRSQYERARSHVGGGVGAAQVVSGRCEGCHISLSPLDIDRLKHTPSGECMPCPECERLLLP
ncbi:MAG: hypothetical protein WCL17_06195 [Actinomycetota bacterium]